MLLTGVFITFLTLYSTTSVCTPEIIEGSLIHFVKPVNMCLRVRLNAAQVLIK